MLKYLIFFLSLTIIPHRLLSYDLKLSLQDAVSLAIKKNRSIIMSTLSRESSKDTLVIAEDQFNIQPNLSISTEYLRSRSNSETNEEKNYSSSFRLSKQFKTGGLIETSYNLIRFDRGYESGYNSGLTISFTQPLLKGFGRRVASASLESAKLSDNISIRSYEDSISSVIKQTIKAFRNLVLAKKQYKIVSRSIKLSEKLFEINKELVKAGRLADIQMVEMKADLLNNKIQLLNAKNIVETAQINLIKLLGIETNLNLEVIPEKVKIRTISRDKVIKTTFENRQEYLNALDQVKLAELSYDVAKNNMLSELNFSTSITSTGEDDTNVLDTFKEPFKGKDWDFRIGMVLNIPLSRITLRANLRQAKNSLLNSKVALEQLKDDILSQIRDVLFQINTAKLQIDYSKTFYEVSKRKLEAEIEKYKAGKTTNFQLLSYKNQLVQSEINLLSAKINYMNLITDLEDIEGILFKKWEHLIPKKIKSLMVQ